MLKICIVEDDKHQRELLVRAVKRWGQFRCLRAYVDAETALAAIPRERPDVVLMDINLPGMNGIECTRRLRAALRQLNIVMLTDHEHPELVFDALKAGATGYLLRKQTTPKQIGAALTEVMRGGSPMTSEIARKVVSHFEQAGDSAELARLTLRERQVLDGLAQGWLYKEIANRFEISIETVRKHLKNIYRKLQVASRTEAVVKYLRRTTRS
jgi:DNA-binding NarL/FixJ family response regulator